MLRDQETSKQKEYEIVLLDELVPQDHIRSRHRVRELMHGAKKQSSVPLRRPKKAMAC